MIPPKQTKIWTTRDGERIRICDMTDTHLVNTINMLVRGAPGRYAHALNQAQCFATVFPRAEDDGCVDHIGEQTDLEFLQESVPIFENLLWEFSRRKLDTELLVRGTDVFEQCYLALYAMDKY